MGRDGAILLLPILSLYDQWTMARKERKRGGVGVGDDLLLTLVAFNLAYIKLLTDVYICQ